MQDNLTAATKENLSEDYFRKWAEELDVREPLILFEQEEEANMIEEKILAVCCGPSEEWWQSWRPVFCQPIR